jgi:predicted metal-binding membrane protein
MAIALVVFVEKVLPQGVAFGRALGVALIAAGAIIVARPDLTMLLLGGM